MQREILGVIKHKIYIPFFIGFILVFNSSPQDKVIPLAAQLGAISMIITLLYILADRSKILWAIFYGVVFGGAVALLGYLIGAFVYDYLL